MISDSVSRSGPVAKGETVYGDGASTCDGGSTEDGDHSPLHGSHGAIAEKVRALANNVYREFEVLIDKYGRDVVSNLMPPVVACLENLDHLYAEKTDLEVEIDLLKEDNQQLLGQFERERVQRKATEEKILEIEDRHEEDRNALTTKIESLEMGVKVAEMKAKSAQDHVSRLEDKEVEMKKENTRLHERYNELLRNHLEVVERGKMASNSDIEAGSVGSAGPMGRHLHHHHHHHHLVVGKSREPKENASERKENEVDEHFYEEDEEPRHGGSFNDNEVNCWEQAREDLGTFEPDSAMFEEMTMPDEEDIATDDEEGRPDVLDDADSESEFGMSKEIDKLINENMELVETKNALNIVKDDLINQVDDLTGENEMLREENNMLLDAKIQLKQRIRAIETELKETRQALEASREKIRELGEEEEEPADGEAGSNPTHKRRFTRAEMVRLLTERNQFKERLMELQEAVRWTEMMRARRDHPELVTENGAGSTANRRGMWKYFSGLFGASAVGDTARRTPPRSSSSHAIAASPSESGSSGVSSSGSGTLAAIASFLSPSPSSPVAANPLFTAPQNAAAQPRAPPDIPKLVPHDVRLIPMPRGGPGAAVKRP